MMLWILGKGAKGSTGGVYPQPGNLLDALKHRLLPQHNVQQRAVVGVVEGQEMVDDLHAADHALCVLRAFAEHLWAVAHFRGGEEEKRRKKRHKCYVLGSEWLSNPLVGEADSWRTLKET